MSITFSRKSVIHGASYVDGCISDTLIIRSMCR